MRRILTRFQGGFTSVVVTWNDLFNSQGVPSSTGLKLVAYGSRLTRPVNSINLQDTCVFSFRLINHHNCILTTICTVTIDHRPKATTLRPYSNHHLQYYTKSFVFNSIFRSPRENDLFAKAPHFPLSIKRSRTELPFIFLD